MLPLDVRMQVSRLSEGRMLKWFTFGGGLGNSSAFSFPNKMANGRGSKTGTKMERWKVETWTKTCVTPPV